MDKLFSTPPPLSLKTAHPTRSTIVAILPADPLEPDNPLLDSRPNLPAALLHDVLAKVVTLFE